MGDFMFAYNQRFLMYLLIAGLLLVSACSAESASSDDGTLPEGYPNQTVEVLVGYGAGGGTDLSARYMVEALNVEGIVEQSFIVENMTGADGAIALRELKARQGNKYTLEAIPEYGLGLWNNDGDLTIEDFTPIASVATDYQTIAVPGDSPFETIEDFLAAMKKDPKSIVISSATSLSGGVGWKWSKIANAIGAPDSPTIVPMEGENAALTALLGGDADATFVVPQLATDHLKKGNIKLLAVMTDERVERFSDVPTLVEKEVDVTYYRPRGFWMNGTVSDSVREYWEAAFEKMVETDKWNEYIDQAGLLNEFMGSEEYTNYIKEEGSLYKEYSDTFKK
ncbi:tripartite tricarboxylate transporter substrate binding protein [Sporosarcina pasteurii]|nr:tripartite tricarboxylate transporter substrate binding protein [Sporosarcina pasteurii]